MIIQKELSVTPEEFYNFMVDSVIEQVHNSFGTDLERKDVKKGYSHKHTIHNDKTGKSRFVKYSITKAVENQEFETVHSSLDYKTTTSYKIEPSAKGTRLIYEQKTDFFNAKQMPHGLGGKIDQLFLKMRLSGSIKSVEKAIKKQRKAS